MNVTLKRLALAGVTGLLMAGAAVGPADAHVGGANFSGGVGGHIGGAHAMGGIHGGGRMAYFGSGHMGHIGRGHHDHFRHGRFFVGDGFYGDDYGYASYGGCGYDWRMWQRTGRAYWRDRYEDCVEG